MAKIKAVDLKFGMEKKAADSLKIRFSFTNCRRPRRVLSVIQICSVFTSNVQSHNLFLSFYLQCFVGF